MKREVVGQVTQYIVSRRWQGRWDDLGGRQPRRGARWDRLDDAMLLALKHKHDTAPLVIERVTYDQVLARVDSGGINGVGTLVERGRRVVVATVIPSDTGHVITVDPGENFTVVRAVRQTPHRPA